MRKKQNGECIMLEILDVFFFGISSSVPAFEVGLDINTHTKEKPLRISNITFAIFRAVASLRVPGGQEFHFPYFSSYFDQFFLLFLKLVSFSSSFWPSGGRLAHPGRPCAILHFYKKSTQIEWPSWVLWNLLLLIEPLDLLQNGSF